MEKILINIAKRQNCLNLHYSYVDAFNDIYIKHWVKTFVLCQWDKINDKIYLEKLESKWITILSYKDNIELEWIIISLSQEKVVTFINTFTEELVILTCKLKKLINTESTSNPDIFRNKHLQRKLIQEYNPDISVKFIEKKLEDLKLEEIVSYIWYPFILKPSSWIQSAWVSKIENENQFIEYINNYKNFLEVFQSKWYNNEIILAEEFVDWEMYSIDYLVDEKWETSLTQAVEVKLWPDIWIDDFMNYSRNINQWVINKFKEIDLNKFVSETVKALWIKNNFIHHEFKINSKWQLKTIEVNWRIWWYRLEMISEAFWVNMLEMLYTKNIEFNLLYNISIILFYSTIRWILKEFNESIVEKFKGLKSFYKIRLIDNFIWKEVWLTKHWFSKAGILKLKNKNFEEFEKDLKVVEENYSKLMILE